MNLGSDRLNEFDAKLERLRSWMNRKSLSSLLITESHNFSWLTCGGENFISFASTRGGAFLLVTLEDVVLVSSNIESARMLEEELGDLPIRNGEYPWHWSSAEIERHYRRYAEGSLVLDFAVENELKAVRDPLLPGEMERYRWLGARAEEAIRTTCLWARPGMTEYEISGRLAEECLRRQIWPALMLIAGDERASRYRHPLPTSQPVRRQFMLVLGARRYGLIANLTRMVSFGPVSPELSRKHEAVCQIDAELILSTRPGVTYGEIFRRGMAAYEQQGYGEEWHLHHQGGPTGYLGRTFRAVPDSPEIVLAGQAVAWNPSVSGTKSEDTILVRENGIEVLTEAKDWPMREVRVGSQSMRRCDILQRA